MDFYNNIIYTNIRFTKFLIFQNIPIHSMSEFAPFGKHTHVIVRPNKRVNTTVIKYKIIDVSTAYSKYFLLIDVL